MTTKILVTGTQGFIGSNLLKKLVNNYNVMEINEDFFEKKNWIELLTYELDKYNPNVVFHVGACSNTLEKNVNYIMKVNFEFSKKISDWCSKKNVKLIYSSSAANYGDNNYFPSNLYAWSKYVAESYINLNGGLSLRYFNVYGPGEEKKGKMSSFIYQSLLSKTENKKRISIFPKKPMRDFVYIDDVVDANIHAMQNYDKLKGKYYEVGSGQSSSFEDILKIINLEFDYMLESEIPDGYQFYTCSNKKKWMSDWSPKYNLSNGIKKYINIIKKN